MSFRIFLTSILLIGVGVLSSAIIDAEPSADQRQDTELTKDREVETKQDQHADSTENQDTEPVEDQYAKPSAATEGVVEPTAHKDKESSANENPEPTVNEDTKFNLLNRTSRQAGWYYWPYSNYYQLPTTTTQRPGIVGLQQVAAV